MIMHSFAFVRHTKEQAVHDIVDREGKRTIVGQLNELTNLVDGKGVIIWVCRGLFGKGIGYIQGRRKGKDRGGWKP